jgi:hypothetical protein
MGGGSESCRTAIAFKPPAHPIDPIVVAEPRVRPRHNRFILSALNMLRETADVRRTANQFRAMLVKGEFRMEPYALERPLLRHDGNSRIRRRLIRKPFIKNSPMCPFDNFLPVAGHCGPGHKKLNPRSMRGAATLRLDTVGRCLVRLLVPCKSAISSSAPLPVA